MSRMSMYPKKRGTRATMRTAMALIWCSGGLGTSERRHGVEEDAEPPADALDRHPLVVAVEHAREAEVVVRIEAYGREAVALGAEVGVRARVGEAGHQVGDR